MSRSSATPAPIYTPETINRFAEAGLTVDIAQDNIGLAPTSPGRRPVPLEAAASTYPDHHDDAAAACLLLANDVRDRMPSRAGTATDGTRPLSSDDVGPQRWAARIVPITPSREQQALLDRHPGQYDMNPATAAADQALLGRLWAWAEETDRYADHPDPAVQEAVTFAADRLASHLRTTHWAFTGEFIPTPHRDTEPRIYQVVGDVDRAFLRGLTPCPNPTATTPDISTSHDEATGSEGEQDTDPGAAARLRRRARLLADQLTSESLSGGSQHELSWGTDPDGHLVTYTPAQPDTGRFRLRRRVAAATTIRAHPRRRGPARRRRHRRPARLHRLARRAPDPSARHPRGPATLPVELRLRRGRARPARRCHHRLIRQRRRPRTRGHARALDRPTGLRPRPARPPPNPGRRPTRPLRP